MIKFRLFSSDESLIRLMIDKLSSVALGNFIFREVNDRCISCEVTDDITKYTLCKLVLTDLNEWETKDIIPIESTNKMKEPTRSYSLAIRELVYSLNGMGFNESLEFINKLSSKGE